MKVPSINTEFLLPSATPPAAAEGPHFSELLDACDGAAGRTAATPDQRARQAAKQLVATTLVAPILAQAHKDPFRSNLFHGGQGEEMFQSQLDTILADRIAGRSRLPLVDSIYRRIMRKAGQTNARSGGLSGPRSPETPALNLHG